MSTSSTLPTSLDMPSMAYQVPVHVPLPTYNWAASDQMQEFCLFKCQLETWTWICKIKAEEKPDYLLCILGKEGYAAMDRWVPSRWIVLRLHREHVRWWDFPTSPFLQAGRHHIEVGQIHWWASRSDMPTCLQGINWQWQWCCNWVWSPMHADSGNPRCWHQAAQTTSKGQLWQEGIAPPGDLQNLLHCWIRGGCHVCGSCGSCCMPHPPGTWAKAADVTHTMPQLHPSTPSQ